MENQVALQIGVFAQFWFSILTGFTQDLIHKRRVVAADFFHEFEKLTFTILEHFFRDIGFLLLDFGYLIEVFPDLCHQFFLRIHVFDRINFLLFDNFFAGHFNFFKSELLLLWILNEKVLDLTVYSVVKTIFFVVQVLDSFNTFTNFIW